MRTAADATSLLQQLIRNACVNNGAPESGGERRSVDTLRAFLPASGFDTVEVEPLPGRASLVCRIEGSDPEAPSLTLMGHTDVVPVADPSRWRQDPFGGELIDGIVWGRGAVDMLDVTATMAVAFAQLVEEGFAPRGTLTYLAVCDEEALGTYGAKHLTETQPDLVRTDLVLTEFGGARMQLGPDGPPVLPVMVGEKGTYWCTIRVTGTPGHASMPFRTDNALVKAAEVVQRLAAYARQPVLHDTWRAFADALPVADEIKRVLLDPGALEAMLASEATDAATARMLHACTHTTFAPTILHGGIKTNVIPDAVELQVDVRTLPGHRAEEVRAMLREALGELYDEVEIVADSDSPANLSEGATTGPAWEAIRDVTQRLVPGARTVPFLIVGATDARFFRKLGATCYGTGIKSDRIGFSDFGAMFHGDDERVDTATLELQTSYWKALAETLVG